MSRATRFPARATGPAERLSGFMAHLRMNGVRAGPAETADALAALSATEAADPDSARLVLKSLLTGDADGWRVFDDLFDAYWYNTGKQKQGEVRADHLRTQAARSTLWQAHGGDDGADGPEDGPGDGPGDGPDDARPDDGEGAAEGTEGRLIATLTDALSRRDLRELMDEDSLRRAEIAAARLARAIRDRRSRRRRRARRGRALDMRRILRSSLARGGEPIDLYRTRRPDRPMRLVVLCDVSGSMTVYARVFLAFVKGLIGADARAEAFLFHTRLMRVTEALRDHDTLRAAGRLSLMAEGFGGGTDIAGALSRFCDGYGAMTLGPRSVVLILSDGYCTSPPEAMAGALMRLRRRSRRIVWLNPLLGWRDYAPVAGGIAAALPFLDAHLPANTLAALTALEPEFARL